MIGMSFPQVSHSAGQCGIAKLTTELRVRQIEPTTAYYTQE